MICYVERQYSAKCAYHRLYSKDVLLSTKGRRGRLAPPISQGLRCARGASRRQSTVDIQNCNCITALYTLKYQGLYLSHELTLSVVNPVMSDVEVDRNHTVTHLQCFFDAFQFEPEVLQSPFKIFIPPLSESGVEIEPRPLCLVEGFSYTVTDRSRVHQSASMERSHH